MGARWKALLIDEASQSTEQLARELEDAGGEVLRASTGAEGLSLLEKGSVDLIILCAERAEPDSLSLLSQLRMEGVQTPVVLLSNIDDPGLRAQAFRRGCDDYLVKPVSAAEVVARGQRRIEVVRALTHAQQEVARLAQREVTDGLTQVANESCFQERLRDEFRRAQRYDDPLALIIADLDHFKNVNDNFGHEVGDQVLTAVGACVTDALRDTDFVARYGGEEFAVLLPRTHLAGALTVAERIVEQLKQLRLGPPGLRITASFGISGFPGRSVNTAAQLVQTTAQALASAKLEGRNKINLFQPKRPPAASPNPGQR